MCLEDICRSHCTNLVHTYIAKRASLSYIEKILYKNQGGRRVTDPFFLEVQGSRETELLTKGLPKDH